MAGLLTYPGLLWPSQPFGQWHDCEQTRSRGLQLQEQSRILTGFP